MMIWLHTQVWAILLESVYLYYYRMFQKDGSNLDSNFIEIGSIFLYK